MSLERNLKLIKEQNNNKSFFRYIGPGILVTVGFIDPGNWTVNLAAGAD